MAARKMATRREFIVRHFCASEFENRGRDVLRGEGLLSILWKFVEAIMSGGGYRDRCRGLPNLMNSNVGIVGGAGEKNYRRRKVSPIRIYRGGEWREAMII